MRSDHAEQMRGRPRWGAAVVAGAVLAGLVATGAVAATGDPLREAVRNGTTRGETEIVGRVAESTGPKGGYVTRQSNVATGDDAGGAAIYGCRAPTESTETCLRASNLSSGLALSLATAGRVAATLEVGDPSGVPFTTNATGLVANLNADKLDGLDAQQIIAEARSGVGGASTGAAGPQGEKGDPGDTGPRGPSNARAAAVGNRAVPPCTGFRTSRCPDLLVRTLGAGDWTVHAKLGILNLGSGATARPNRCGLVLDGETLDIATHHLAPVNTPGDIAGLPLTTVVTDVDEGAALALRCTEQPGENLSVSGAKIVAVQVETVIQ